MPLALEIAFQTGRTVYDSLYLALELHQEYPLVTGDRKFHNALRRSQFSPHLVWVGDVS